jgi:GNAT superfamily N-acetyltransferase
MATAKIEAAVPGDALDAAMLASVKRTEYAEYSPVFWRVAENAREIHEPFLARCIADRELFTSLAARSDDRLAGIAITAHKVFPPPFSKDPEPSWLTDDFFVATPDQWLTVGAHLLRETERQAKAGEAKRLIVLTARADEPKRQMLESAGYSRGASWWVHPVTPREADPPTLQTTEAVVGQAPRVYDPGGPTALALSLTDPGEVAIFDEWVASSGAVLGIVPARSSAPEIEDALRLAGYEPASDWFVKTLV